MRIHGWSGSALAILLFLETGAAGPARLQAGPASGSTLPGGAQPGTSAIQAGALGALALQPQDDAAAAGETKAPEISIEAARVEGELRALHVDSEHTEARHHLDELRAELAPEVDGLIESGRKHFREEDLQSALDQWRRALLIDPHNERAREYVARAERMLENLERLRSEPPNHVGAR